MATYYASAPALSGTITSWTYPVVHEPAPKPEPIYKCDVFGDNAAVVIFIYDKKHVPGWFRRQCQRFFLNTKWTKL
jgi:hypothetical protein